ncbi:hypothetical protein C6T65_21580 [Burkholderia vietnamiensis]|uniref:Uncharacterized protein n=1 Tax=Burkholderia vietnamiensis TaxID=60552 RepID=A0AA44XYB5_BURVI|nr:hypothetical protein A8H33_21440 [Burkholderia vietnamiensis]PRH40385.1 hypothetical protein C6T65_21580 [Burkholderia vietnamiensis]
MRVMRFSRGSVSSNCGFARRNAHCAADAALADSIVRKILKRVRRARRAAGYMFDARRRRPSHHFSHLSEIVWYAPLASARCSHWSTYC